MILIAFYITILAVTLYYLSIHYGRTGRYLKLIPGPPSVPIFGNILTLHKTTEDLWITLREFGKKWKIYKVWSFSVPTVNIRHPEDIEVVLSTTKFTGKGLIYTFLYPWFGTGLLTSSGSKWQNRRKVLTPAFHFNVLQQFVEIFIEESEHMVSTLKADGGPAVRDLLHFVSELTLNVICETAMGTSLKGKEVSFQHKYRKAVYDIGQLLLYRLLRPWLFFDVTFYLSFSGWKQIRVLKILHGFTKQIIKERKQYHANTQGKYLEEFKRDANENYMEDDTVLRIRKKRLAMLDLLIAAQKENQIDDEGICEEVDTFMFEGHDTTAMAICFSLMLLAEHKEIQERVRAEVDDVFLEHDGKMNMSGLQKLHGLERCIKESLRLYPSVHFISRKVDEDMQLKDFLIPAGCLVNIHIVDTHRDPDFWPNPDVFDPDRFLPENIQGRHNYCYVPFSAGPRNCIGQRFAMLELKTVLSHLLHNFIVEPIDRLKDLRFITDLVMRPSHPIRVKFIPREL